MFEADAGAYPTIAGETQAGGPAVLGSLSTGTAVKRTSGLLAIVVGSYLSERYLELLQPRPSEVEES